MNPLKSLLYTQFNLFFSLRLEIYHLNCFSPKLCADPSWHSQQTPLPILVIAHQKAPSTTERAYPSGLLKAAAFLFSSSLFTCMCMCGMYACVYIYVCICGYIWVSGKGCPCTYVACVWRPEFDISCLSPFLYMLNIESESLIWTQSCWFSSTSHSLSQRYPVSYLTTPITGGCYAHPAFT